MRELDMFLNTLKSEHTKIAYKRVINNALNYIKKGVRDINAADLIEWSNSLSAYSSATQNQYINAIKSFFEFLVDIDYIDKNPARKLKLKKVVNKPKDVVNDEEVKCMLKMASNKRDKAIISVLFSTGMRVNELINLKLDDLTNESIYILAKGGVYREVFINEDCMNNISAYLDDRKYSEYDNLFISNQGTPMKEANINSMLKKIAKRCGIDKNITPHSLRHTFVTDIAAKYGVEVARDAVGHANLSTTNRYIHTNRKQIKDAMMAISL